MSFLRESEIFFNKSYISTLIINYNYYLTKSKVRHDWFVHCSHNQSIINIPVIVKMEYFEIMPEDIHLRDTNSQNMTSI